MKSKIRILVLTVACCCMLTACNVKSNENSNTSTGILQMEKQDELGVNISTVEQIFIDEYKGQKDNSKCVQQIIERLGGNGYIAIDSENKVDMTNADDMRQFINRSKSGEQTKVYVLQIFYSGGCNILSIESDKGRVCVVQNFYSFQEGHLKESSQSEFEANYFEYTDEGYLLIEGYWHSPQKYVLTLSEEEEHIALRVDSLDEKCRGLCAKYMTPISYNLNNMFITNWNEENYSELDFYDIFERFYSEIYGKDCPYIMNEDLSIGNEYEIPADEFEAIIKQHYKISSEVLHMLLRYDSDKNVYIYRPRGFDEFDYAEVPYPEVVGYEENEDGSITLLVNAVYPNSDTSKLFSHEVTVLEEDGRIYYLANKIIGDKELDLWWHADRLTDGEWDDYYKGGADL